MSIQCPACGVEALASDEFCASCGGHLPSRGGRRFPRRVLLGAAVGVVVATSAAVLLVVANQGSDDVTGSDAGASAKDTQASEVAQALMALESEPSTLVASQAKDLVDGRAATAVPPGTSVDPEVDSWAPDGLGGGTMLVTLTSSGGQSVTYAVVVVQERGDWKVMATAPLSPSKGAKK